MQICWSKYPWQDMMFVRVFKSFFVDLPSLSLLFHPPHRFFLEHLYLDHDGWNLIFYTGKTPLPSSIEEIDLKGANVRIVKGRPDFSSVVPNVIYGIESKEGRASQSSLIPRYIPSLSLLC